MQNTISVFSFKSQNVRTQILGAEPWFCLGDVAEILQIQNARQLPLKDQGIQKSSVATKKGNQELLFINEPNLYRVIFRSRKAEAVKFQDWIFEEVIPQIRKTGGYQITPKTTADDRTGLRQAVAALVGRKGIDYSSAYSMIHQRFNVEAIEDIPAEKLPEAVAYVHALTLHTGLTGEILDREPLPAPFDDLDVAHLLLHAQDIRLFIRRYLPAFENLSIDKGGALWSYVHDTAPVFNRVRAAVLPRLKDQWLQRQIMKTAGV